ncbi:MAG: hypothetical protein HQM16_11165 [Deltaproteobacteria bacterium]|nr:hypothetical protein [Deltaproteobacteria bacterium]
MSQNHILDNVLDAAEGLSQGEQEVLIEVLHKRLVELRRKQLAQDITDANQELKKGQCHEVSAADLIKEVTS